MRYRSRLALVLVGLALFASGIATALLYAQAKESLEADIESKAISIASSAAAALDGDELVDVMRRGNADERRDVEAQLARIRDANRRVDVHVHFVYAAVPAGGGSLVTVASSGGEPGERRGEADLASRDHLRIGQTGVEEMKQDDYGTWISGYAPVRDHEGRAVAALVVDVEAGELIDRIHTLLWSGLAAAGTALVLAVGLAVPVARRVSRPLDTIVQAMERVAGGEVEARAEVHTRDEFERAADALNVMVPRLREHLRLLHSVELARDVQRNLLPITWPQIAGFGIAAASRTCDEIGGDYYDLIDLSQGSEPRIAIAVGDVAGHGVAAALLMATMRAMLRARAARRDGLAPIVTDVNASVSADRFSERFVTLFLLEIDTRELVLRWVCAGHEPAIVYDPATDTFEELGGNDLPLGVRGDWEYREHTRVGWRAGQVILIGTDGIWETRGGDGRMFGKDALRELVRAHAARAPREILDAVLAELERFRGGAAQADDVTLVVLKA